MFVIVRFAVPLDRADDFEARARAAADFFAGRPGCESAEIGKNVDDPELWALVTRWADVCSYRRAYNGYEAKMTLMPLLNEAIDEPTAYADAADVGFNVPRGSA